MGAVVGLIVGAIIGGLISGLVIWVVGKLGLGLEVSGFGAAFVGALVIAVVGFVVNWVLSALSITIGGGLGGAIVHLVIAALVLMAGGATTPGLKVRGGVGSRHRHRRCLLANRTGSRRNGVGAKGLTATDVALV